MHKNANVSPCLNFIFTGEKCEVYMCKKNI